MSDSTGLVTTAEQTYDRLNLPPLPASIRELLVTFAPWLSLLSGLLGLLVFPIVTLVSVILAPLIGVSGGGLGYIFGIIHLILSIAGAVLSLMAFSGLRSRSLTGWTRMFWAGAIYVVAGLLPLSFGGLITTIIGAAITFYLLFQVKPYYDGRMTSAA